MAIDNLNNRQIQMYIKVEHGTPQIKDISYSSKEGYFLVEGLELNNRLYKNKDFSFDGRKVMINPEKRTLEEAKEIVEQEIYDYAKSLFDSHYDKYSSLESGSWNLKKQEASSYLMSVSQGTADPSIAPVLAAEASKANINLEDLAKSIMNNFISYKDLSARIIGRRKREIIRLRSLQSMEEVCSFEFKESKWI